MQEWATTGQVAFENLVEQFERGMWGWLSREPAASIAYCGDDLYNALAPGLDDLKFEAFEQAFLNVLDELGGVVIDYARKRRV